MSTSHACTQLHDEHMHPCAPCRYVIAYKPDEYAFIYYRGNNDAWSGYGGATVYTRCAGPCPCLGAFMGAWHL